MNNRPTLMLRVAAVAAMLLSLAAVGPAAGRAAKRYPYRLVVPGTFGGPSNYLDEPGIPFTSKGILIGAADTRTRDSAYDGCPSGFCDGYQQHAFAWRNGKLTDLGVLPGMTGSFIDQLNSHGIGAGGVEKGMNPNTPVGDRAVLFAHGRVISLGTLPGGSHAFAQNIDNRGQVAGYSNNATPDRCSFFGWGTQTRGFVWRDGVMHDLGTLGGADTVISWQNDHGQIAGLSYTSNKPDPANNGCPGFAPFLWQHGKMIDLGTLGGTLGLANWINDRGEVVGFSNLAGDKNAHPFLWRDGKMIDLGTPGGNFGQAVYISDSGDTAGFYATPDGHAHAILWRGRRMVKLPTVGAATNAFANAVNNRGQVVGNENDSHGNEIIASLWTRGHGYDLSTLVAPTSFQMVSADYIDAHGNIVGHGVYTSGPHKGDARMFLLLRNPSVPLAGSSAGRKQAPIPALSDQRHIGFITPHTGMPGGIAPAGITNPLNPTW